MPMRIHKLFFLTSTILLFNVPLICQSSTISGTITDAETGEFLIGANIVLSKSGQGVTTNNYGFYSFTIPEIDSTGIVYAYLGYQTLLKKIFLEHDLRLDIELSPIDHALDEVVISSKELNDNISKVNMSVIDIPITKINELPVILGEPDVLKIVQLLPGVKAGNEGTTGYHVRGGNADQNLVLLDGAIVYNPNHLVGLVSAFNSRAINNVTLIKGGFGAEYGGRLSSMLDISLKEGNKKKFSGEGGVGLISSQLTLGGPLKKNESSYSISGRRTYFDILFKPFLPATVKTNYVFYDYNAKANYKLGENDRVYLSGFLSKDDAYYAQEGIEYNLLLNNKTATVRWNHIFNPKLFGNASLIYTGFDQNVSALQDNAISKVASSIEDFSAKIKFEYYPNQKNKINFGFQYFDHTFRSSGDSKVFSGAVPDSQIPKDSIPLKTFDEYAFFANGELGLTDAMSVNLGVRFTRFYDSTVSYNRIEPRLAMKYALNESTSIKGSYTLMNQFIHLIPSSAAAIPSDIWVPSTTKTKPQRSQQVALGLFKNNAANTLEGSVEVYYKSMDDQILFREGNQLIRSLDVDDLLVYGKGWSYGSEFFLKKKAGRLSGWAAYTLSWAYQQFPDLNFGTKFPFRHDRRHDLSLVSSYELNSKWTFSASFVYSSGSAITVPHSRTSVINGGSLFEGNYYLFDKRNNARLPSFNRLNISAIHKKKRKIFNKSYDSQWVFSLYNAYNRQNPYFIYFDIDPLTERPRAKQVSLLPIIPSVSYNFKF